MSGKKDNKKEKLKSLKKADERLKKEKKGVKKTKRKRVPARKLLWEQRRQRYAFWQQVMWLGLCTIRIDFTPERKLTA